MYLLKPFLAPTLCKLVAGGLVIRGADPECHYRRADKWIQLIISMTTAQYTYLFCFMYIYFTYPNLRRPYEFFCSYHRDVSKNMVLDVILAAGL